jgi:quercetin dioxygenase-like cupin family protein
LAALVGALAVATLPAAVGHAQTIPSQAPRGCSTPVAERKVEAGCYTTAEVVLGPLAATPQYWHIYEMRVPGAAKAGPIAGATVVQSFARTWVFAIAPERWQVPGAEKVATIGPLQVTPQASYTARYMEASFPPDLSTALIGHRHPGSEAWYVLSGTQCLETPNGLILASAGQAAMVPEGWPMAISAVGARTRRALVLVLHRSDEPYSMPVHQHTHAGAPHADWTPRGLCPQ